MLTRLFLFPKDLMKIENISITTAYKRYNELLFLLNKPSKSKLSLKEYAEFNGLQVSELNIF